MSIEVISRNLPKGTGSELPPVMLDLERQSMRLRDLIVLTVTEQVNELATRLAAERASTDRANAEATIEVVAEVGRYYLLSGSATEASRSAKQTDDAELPDVDVAVAQALHGFESNRYIVLIGRKQIDDLDHTVDVPPGTTVTFLRLTPLQGG